MANKIKELCSRLGEIQSEAEGLAADARSKFDSKSDTWKCSNAGVACEEKVVNIEEATEYINDAIVALKKAQ